MFTFAASDIQILRYAQIISRFDSIPTVYGPRDQAHARMGERKGVVWHNCATHPASSAPIHALFCSSAYFALWSAHPPLAVVALCLYLTRPSIPTVKDHARLRHTLIDSNVEHRAEEYFVLVQRPTSLSLFGVEHHSPQWRPTPFSFQHPHFFPVFSCQWWIAYLLMLNHQYPLPATIQRSLAVRVLPYRKQSSLRPDWRRCLRQ